MNHLFNTFGFLFILLMAMQTQAQKLFNADYDMPVGVYYYPEHWDESQWERDIKHMADLGFAFTHYAEFAWSKMEPTEGNYDFDWLDKCIELAHKNGMQVIMCTPTPTPPAWLTQKHPEILVVNDEGQQIKHGTRLHANIANPVYQQYIEKIVSLLAKRYGNHPAVAGWQIDNEPHFASMYDYSEFAQQDFKNWLKNNYQHIDSLNKAWGNAFWSMTYNNFEQIRIPNKLETLGANPQALLDFKRYNAQSLASGIAYQAKLLKKNISNAQWVTTNYAYYEFLPAVDIFLNRDHLDFASHTMYLINTYIDYPTGNLAHRIGSGLQLSLSNEMAKSVSGYTGIMELQPGQINWGKWNSQPLPGAVRMWIWHSFGLGDKFTCAYRFRQPLFNSEQYHKGIVLTDGVTVARGGMEYVNTINELKEHTSGLKKTSLPKEVQSRKTAFLWNQDNLYSLESAKHTEYWDIWDYYYNYYGHLKSMACPVDFVTEDIKLDPETFPFTVAPAYVMTNDAIINNWKQYVEKGGHLILTSRTGMFDKHGQLWEARLQEPIYELIGATLDDYDQLTPSTKAKVAMNGQNFSWYVWGDLLQPAENTEILVQYSSEFYEGTPAVTRQKIGKGSVTYMGVWTEYQQLEKQVIRKIYQDGNANIMDLPDDVFVEYRNGLYVAVSYRSDTTQLNLPEKTMFIIGNKTLVPAGVSVFKLNQ